MKNTYKYSDMPKVETIEINNCNLCGGDPSLRLSNYGYCSRSVTIKCLDCGISLSDSAELNNGGQIKFDLSVIMRWNRLHNEK